MGYYGQLFPNTYYTKESTRSWWDQGGSPNFADSYALVVPVAVVGGVAGGERTGRAGSGLRDRWIVVAAVEAAAIGHTIAVVRVGGDYMTPACSSPPVHPSYSPGAALRRPPGPAQPRPRRRLAVWALVAAFHAPAARGNARVPDHRGVHGGLRR